MLPASPLSDQPEVPPGSRVFGATPQPGGPGADDPAERDRRTALLAAVARIAEGFVRSEDWREAVPGALAELGEAAGVGRVYVFENHPGPDDRLHHSLRFEWLAPGVPGFIDDPSNRDMPYRTESGPGWFDDVAAGRPVCTSMADETNPVRRASMQRWGIVSIAVVPIHVHGSWWGYVAYDDVETPRAWSAGELDALRTAAGLLAAAIERRRDRLQRHAASEKYRALVEQVPSVVYAEYLDGPDGDEMGESYMSPQVTSLFGYAPHEWLDVRRFWSDIVHPEDFARLRELADRSLEHGDPWHVEYRIRTADGRIRWVLDEATMLTDPKGEPFVWQGVVTDITEAKNAEADRRKLLRRVVEAQEQERRRIASDVHDDQIQKLTAVSLRLQTFRQHVEDEQALDDLRSLEQTVGRAIESLRHLLFELRPKLLDDVGLTAALTQYARRAELDSGIEHTVMGDLEVEPPSEVRGVAYRIAQEALSNARRHANAERIEVQLLSVEDAVLLRIIDNGDGFEQRSEDEVEGHLGLSTMRERAELAGGWLRIRSAHARGTTVEFGLPLYPR